MKIHFSKVNTARILDFAKYIFNRSILHPHHNLPWIHSVDFFKIASNHMNLTWCLDEQNKLESLLVAFGIILFCLKQIFLISIPHSIHVWYILPTFTRQYTIHGCYGHAFFNQNMLSHRAEVYPGILAQGNINILMGCGGGRPERLECIHNHICVWIYMIYYIFT